MKKKGRKVKSRFERTRIRIWGLAVHASLKESGRSIEEVLGKDGEWDGLWSRYFRGLVAPSTARLDRIEGKIPHTAIYYSSPIWTVATDMEWTWSRQLKSVQSLDPLFRDAFEKEEDLRDMAKTSVAKQLQFLRRTPVHKRRADVAERIKDLQIKWWRTDFYHGTLFRKAFDLIVDRRYGMDALTTIFLMYKECLLQKDEDAAYKFGIAWAAAEIRRREHPLLSFIPTDIFRQVLEPIRGYIEDSTREENIGQSSFPFDKVGLKEILGYLQADFFLGNLSDVLDDMDGYIALGEEYDL